MISDSVLNGMGAVVCLLGFVACVDPSAEAPFGPDVEAEEGPVEPVACPIDLPSAPGNVEFRDGPGATWEACGSNPDMEALSCGCVDEYLRLPERAADFSHPVSTDVLEVRFEQMRRALSGEPTSVEVLTDPLPPEDLAQALILGEGTCFLREGAAERPLIVEITAREPGLDFDTWRLRLQDPWVGRLEALLLRPHGDGPYPGLVAMHGHGESAQDWIDRYRGEAYAKSGFTLFAPTQRAMCGDEGEDLTTRTLLKEGWSLLGIRSYEAMLGRKVLRALSFVDGDSIGLIGHSTGSVAANVTMRTAAGFSAGVTDLADSYYSYLERPLVTDVMSPGVFPYHVLVNDLPNSDVPVLEVGYGYRLLSDEFGEPDEIPRILEFLHRELDR